MGLDKIYTLPLWVHKKEKKRIARAYEPDVIIVLILYGFRPNVGGLRKTLTFKESVLRRVCFFSAWFSVFS